MDTTHFKALKSMYENTPINALYNPTIQISIGKSIIEQEVQSSFFHAANALHGSVYFKLLDDAAFFAVNSIVDDVFVLTANFETKFLRPIKGGSLVCKGELIKNLGNKFEARAKLFNDGVLVGSGHGIFVKSTMKLEEVTTYQ